MKNIGIKILILLLTGTAPLFSLDSLYLRVGYGGNWQFFTTQFTGSIPEKYSDIIPADIISVGGDLKLTPMHAVAATYEQNFLFSRTTLRYGSVAYKWFPFSWYNQLFIGAGIGYLTMDVTNTVTEKRFAGHISYGLNIQFPANIFILVEFKHLVNSRIEYKTPSTDTTYDHNLILTGSIAYRLEIDGAKH